MTLDFTTGLYLVAFVQAVFFLVLIIRERHETVGAVSLMGVLFIAAYWLLTGLIIQSGLYERWPHAQGWFPMAAWCLGPLMYHYTRAIAGAPKAPVAHTLLHFAPAVLMTLLALPGVFATGAEKAAHVAMMADHHMHSIPMVLLIAAAKAHMLIYLLESWRQLAHTAPERQRWHQRFVGTLIVAEALWVALFALHLVTGLLNFTSVIQHWGLFLSLTLLLQVATAVRTSSFMAREKTAEKYGRAALPKSTARDIAAQIEHCLVDEQLFLRTDLTLGNLSDHLRLGRHLVSQVINEHLHTSFYRLINRHRVAFAKPMLADPTLGFSVERIAIESGFNNRVTFNKAFKELEGISPSEYRRSAKPKPAIA